MRWAGVLAAAALVWLASACSGDDGGGGQPSPEQQACHDACDRAQDSQCAASCKQGCCADVRGDEPFETVTAVQCSSQGVLMQGPGFAQACSS